MPYFKAIKDQYTDSNERYISKDEIYKVYDFDILDKGMEFAIIDNYGAEIWFTDIDNCEFNYKKYFKKVNVIILEKVIS